MMRHGRLCYVIMFATLWAGCTKSTDPSVDAALEPPTVLSASQQALRISMALRGEHPTRDEMLQAEQAPETLDGLVDAWLETDAFGETMRDLHHEIWGLRSDLTFFPIVDDLETMGKTLWEVNQSVYEAPLRLIEDVIRNDRPYSDILTADYTLADASVAAIWGLDSDESLDQSGIAQASLGWQRMRWGDERPSAGILASAAIFDRHRSNGQNYQRGRAQIVAEALLCHDYLAREIPIDGSVNLTDVDAVAEAVTANAACVSCHQTLDPLASFLSGHRNAIFLGGINAYPIVSYNPNNESNWIETTRRAPGFFGDQGGDLKTLGAAIGQDPRFALCTVERFWSFFHQSPREELTTADRNKLYETFKAADYNAKELVKAIVLDTGFHASYSSSDSTAENVKGYYKLRPEQMARLFESLVGFHWTTDINLNLAIGPFGRTDLMRSDVLGFRSLFGGTDGYYGGAPVHSASITSSLVLEQLASHAAQRAVEIHFGEAGSSEQRDVLWMVTSDSADENTTKEWIADLHFDLYGERVEPKSETVADGWQLLSDLRTLTGDEQRAWAGLLTAMFRDPNLLYY